MLVILLNEFWLKSSRSPTVYIGRIIIGRIIIGRIIIGRIIIGRIIIGRIIIGRIIIKRIIIGRINYSLSRACWFACTICPVINPFMIIYRHSITRYIKV